jgi:hypothetical protein
VQEAAVSAVWWYTGGGGGLRAANRMNS